MKTRHQLIVDQIVTSRILNGDNTDPRIMTAEESIRVSYIERRRQVEALLD